MASVLRVLKNLAVKEGYVPRVFKDFGSAILKTGFVYNIPKTRTMKREVAGLPPLSKTKIDDIKKLAEKTGFINIIEGEESDDR